MKTTLLLLTTAILGVSFQANAMKFNGYAALRGGYASMKHQTQEHYGETTRPIKNDWDGDAGIGSVAFGLRAGYLRLEVEGNGSSTTKETKKFSTDGYVTTTTTTSRINTSSALFNSYLELPVDFPLRPYISAGAGMAHIKGKFKTRPNATTAKTTNISGNHFAWQVGAGLAYEITPEWAVDLGYRFMNYGSIKKRITDHSGGESIYLGNMKLDAKVYSAYLGVRYAF